MDNLSAVQKTLESVERTRKTLEILALPAIENVRKIDRIMEEATRPMREMNEKMHLIIEEATKPVVMIAESLKSFYELQQRWVSAVSLFGIETPPYKEPKTKIKLISYENDEIRFELRTNPVRKNNSLHLLLLIALLFESDETGFISYQRIEEFFVKKGKAAKEDIRSSRKRIWDTIPAMFRFLNIPSQYKGLNLFEKVAGRGLRLKNPEVEI